MRKPFVGVVALTGLLAGCAGAGSGGEIVIGAAGPFSEGYGDMNRKGAQLAIQELNARGGIRGRTLRLDAQDDSSSGQVAVRIAEGFVANPALVAVVGHVNSGAMMMAARVYDGALPAVATTASSSELTGISPWVFRVISNDSANALDMARHASRMGFRRAAILYDNDSYGRGLAALFRKHFGGEVISTDPIEAGASDLEPFVSYYRARQPDLVFVAGTEGSGLTLLREARRQGLRTDFMGGDGWVGLATTDGKAAEGAIIFAPFTPADPRPEVQKFVAAFTTAYGVPPDANSALAYDATMLIAKGIAEVGADREAVREWLAELDEKTQFPGVTGPIRFHPSGDRMGQGFLATRVRNGVLVVEKGA